MSRLVDRSLRPAFPPGWGHDTQVQQTSVPHRPAPPFLRDERGGEGKTEMCPFLCSWCYGRSDACATMVDLADRMAASVTTEPGQTCTTSIYVSCECACASVCASLLQVLQWVMSYDGASTTEPLAITAASAALAVSGAM